LGNKGLILIKIKLVYKVIENMKISRENVREYLNQ